MARKVIGLDVDYSTLKAAEVVRKGRNRVVTKLGAAPLADGTIRDGKIQNSGAFLQGLESLLLQNDYSASSVVLGLRSSWVTIKPHKLPQMPKRELDKVLEFELPELVSFPFDSLKEVAYDYFINKEWDQEMEIVLVACPRSFLTPYIDAMKTAGLTLEAIDLPALSWPSLLADELTRAFVEVSEQQTIVQVSLGEIFKVMRVVPIGTLHYLEGVQEAFHCSFAEAKQLMERHDLDYLLLEGTANKRVLRATVQQFVGSVLQTLDFVRAQERASSFRSLLAELVVIGDLADLKGLPEMLGKELDLPVRSLKEQNLRVSFDLARPSRFNCYGSALALGLRGIEK